MRKTVSSLVSLGGSLLLGLAACGGGGGGDSLTNDTADYTVTVTPAAASVVVGATQQFTAQVSATTNTGVTWSVYGSGNCVGDACGTITSSGLYTAPATVPNPATVTVQATSKDNPQSGAVAVVTILPGVSVSVSPQSANVPVDGTQQFTAIVQNATNTAVTWAVSGTGCSGAACGTITDTGLYTAPSAAPDPATVTVTATSEADASKSASAVVTIGGSSLDRLSGHYAFLLRGYDADGLMQVAGVFVADGNGNLTSGVHDVNSISGAHAQVAFTGTYTLGADGRGEMVLTSTLGTSTYRFALNGDATEGRMIEFDDSGTRSTGLFISQNQVSFSNSTVTGDYVLSLDGTIPMHSRVAAVGRFHADGAGNFTNGQWDFADSTLNPPAMASWTGTYAVDSVGRGTAILNIPGIGPLNFSFYVGYTNHNVISEPPAMFFVSMDAMGPGVPMLSGAIQQAYPTAYSDNSWPADGFPKVFALSGLLDGWEDSVGTVGAFETDGAGNLTGVYDRNYEGAIWRNQNFTGTYSIQPSGRGTGTLQLTSKIAVPIIFYLATPDRGVVMGSPGFDAQLGFIWSMSGVGAPGDPSILSGDYAMGSFAFTSHYLTAISGVLHADGVSIVNGTQDYSYGSSRGVLAFAGMYYIGDHGRGEATVNEDSLTVIYVVSPDKFIVMPITAGDEPVMLILNR